MDHKRKEEDGDNKQYKIKMFCNQLFLLDEIVKITNHVYGVIDIYG